MREISKIRLAISYYCELRCRHCYVPQKLREEYDKIMENELSIDQIIDFICYLTDEYGLRKVDITGGEALLKTVWQRTEAVVGYALSRGLEVQINTTGSGDILPKKIKDTFSNHLDNLLLHVSLDGIDEYYVDRFRGHKGAYKSSLEFMKQAIELGMNVRTRFTMTPENLNQVVPCYKLVSELGVKSFMCKPVNIVGTSLKNHLDTLTYDDLRRIQLDLLMNSIGNKTQLHLPAPLAIRHDDIAEGVNVQIFHCLCGQHLIYIAYNGDIFPCTYMAGMADPSKYIIGNIKDPNFNFSEIWEREDTYSEFRNADRYVCTSHQLSNTKGCD